MNIRHLCKSLRRTIPGILLAGGMLFAVAVQAAAPVVSGVTGHQRTGTKLVDINYTATDADGDQMSISVSAYYINKSGMVASVPVRTLTGDGANGVKVNSGPHAMVWDAAADWPGQFSDKFAITVTADDGKGSLLNYLVIDLSEGVGAAYYPVTYMATVPNPIPDDYRTTKLVMRKIPAGAFIMGSAELENGHQSNEVQHQVTLTKAFYIGVFEVTQKQWELVMGTNPSSYKGDMRPVDYVSYNAIRGSGNWPTDNSVGNGSFLGRLRYATGIDFDIPTEAQWEYACRAGTATGYNSGKNWSGLEPCPNMNVVGRYNNNQNDGKGGYTSAHTNVGSYLPNAWGLYDMHGNVWEWCLDYRDGTAYPSTAVSDPPGPASGSSRVIRGGCWYNTAMYCRSAFRADYYPDNSYYYYGFRLLRAVP
jgi:formylglycine-generating enzyme required for sulfatase activity